MKFAFKASIVSVLLGCSLNSLADNVIPGAPAWSTPARGDAVSDHVSDIKQRLEGSSMAYTQTQIDNKFHAPDWFPENHQPMPEIVKHGKAPKVWACASCHLASGLGHPESSGLAGLSADYIEQQLEKFASGERIDYSGHMNRMAALLTEQEMRDAAAWFASLKAENILQVIETSTVPVTIVDETRMRLIIDDTQEQPIGSRIIEVPENEERVKLRAPKETFLTYVPLRSIERGKSLVVSGGGKTVPCSACHGGGLTGSAIAPSIAGRYAIYTVRQLHGFKSGSRKSAQMASVVSGLSDDDIIDIAAYLASVSVNNE